MSDKIQAVREFHDREASEYVSRRYDGSGCEQLAYRIRKGIVLSFLDGVDGPTLDAGCGPGILTPDLVAAGLRPVCLDLSPAMLDQARHILDRPGAAIWINGEIERLPFPDGCFDNVLAIGVIAYARNSAATIAEFARVLSPGGMLILQSSNPLAPAPRLVRAKDASLYALRIRRRPYHFGLTGHTARAITALLEDAGFRVDALKGYDYRLPFIEKIFPRAAVRIMATLQRLLGASQAFTWAAEGYVLRATLRPQGPAGPHLSDAGSEAVLAERRTATLPADRG